MEQQGGVWRMVAAMGMAGTIGAFVLLSGQSPQTVVMFRCLIGGAALLGYLVWRGGWKRPDARALGWIALGGAGLILNWLCLFSAYSLSNISIATVVYQVQPFLLILLDALARRQMPAWRKLPWLAAAFLGVALTTGIDLAHRSDRLMLGVLLALGAALFYALSTLATRRLQGYQPAQIAGLQLAMGFVVLAPMSHFSPAAIPLMGWSSLLTIGLVHTALVYELMYAAFQRLRADMIATLSFVYPLVGIAVDLIFFDTRLSLVQQVGIGLVLVSVLANQREPQAKAYAKRWPAKVADRVASLLAGSSDADGRSRRLP